MTTLTFAIGDIHGCYTKLLALLANCVRYANKNSCRHVFLGDYIDRGPDSRGVIELLSDENRCPHSICLKGNHEDMLLAALGGERERVEHWFANGAEKMLESYGVKELRDLPREHIAWIRSRPIFYDDGMRFFVHAGIDPRRHLNQQEESVMLWVREHEFADWDTDVGRLVVHGHTPVPSGLPDLRLHRLNVDTGAVIGGPLTAAVFNNERVGPTAFITDDGAVTRL